MQHGFNTKMIHKIKYYDYCKIYDISHFLHGSVNAAFRKDLRKQSGDSEVPKMKRYEHDATINLYFLKIFLQNKDICLQL
jgi:hypothetical protein